MQAPCYLLSTRQSSRTKTETFYPHTLGHLFSTGTTPPCSLVLCFLIAKRQGLQEWKSTTSLSEKTGSALDHLAISLERIIMSYRHHLQICCVCDVVIIQIFPAHLLHNVPKQLPRLNGGKYTGNVFGPKIEPNSDFILNTLFVLDCFYFLHRHSKKGNLPQRVQI